MSPFPRIRVFFACVCVFFLMLQSSNSFNLNLIYPPARVPGYNRFFLMFLWKSFSFLQFDNFFRKNYFNMIGDSSSLKEIFPWLNKFVFLFRVNLTFPTVKKYILTSFDKYVVREARKLLDCFFIFIVIWSKQMNILAHGKDWFVTAI